jgi:hypothetical protein
VGHGPPDSLTNITIHVVRKGAEESSMFWWIVDLFLDRDWSDLLGLVFLIAVFIVIVVLVVW